MGGPRLQSQKVIMTGAVEHLDPTTLHVGENLRDNAALDSQFVASVREHGVLQPINATRTDTRIEVRDGQLSLAEVAAMREFEDDDHAVNALLAVAGTGTFDHRVA